MLSHSGAVKYGPRWSRKQGFGGNYFSATYPQPATKDIHKILALERLLAPLVGAIAL